MKALLRMTLLPICLVLSFLIPVAAYPGQKHECSFCHLPHAGGKGMLLLKESVNDLCLGCHPREKYGAHHPIDVVSLRPVKELPLSRDGKITCVTCHDPHRWSSPSLLRIEQAELCLKCHDR